MPDQLALRFLGDKDEDVLCLTYAQIDRSARAVAAHLQAAGASGERALVLHPPGAEYISALLGCFYAGVVAVPAYPPRFNRTMERLRDIVVDARARFALTTHAALEKIERHSAMEPELANLRWIATDRIDDSQAPAWRSPEVDSNTIAFLQYTSGSTSSPKGVMLSHRNLLANIEGIALAMRITNEDHMVTWLPPYHDMGLIGTILLPLCLGIPSTQMTPAAFLQRPFRWLQATPSTWAMLIEAGWSGDARLKILCGGEALSGELARELLVRAGSVWNMYGPTETTIWSALHRVTAADAAPIPVGAVTVAGGVMAFAALVLSRLTPYAAAPLALLAYAACLWAIGGLDESQIALFHSLVKRRPAAAQL